jgi:hypothetical protein
MIGIDDVMYLNGKKNLDSTISSVRASVASAEPTAIPSKERLCWAKSEKVGSLMD